MSKRRLSVSVDSERVEAGEASVARGRAKTLSAWVNDALQLQADHDRRLEALSYQSERRATVVSRRPAARRG